MKFLIVAAVFGLACAMPQPEALPEADPAANPEADPFLFYSGLGGYSGLPLTYSTGLHYTGLPFSYGYSTLGLGHGLGYSTILGRKKREAEPTAEPEPDPFLLYSAGLPLTYSTLPLNTLPLTYSTLKVAAPKITYKAAPLTTYTATYPFGYHGLPLIYGK